MRTLLLGLALAAGPLAAAHAAAQDAPPPPPGGARDARMGDGRMGGGRMGGAPMGGLGMAGLMAADANHDGVVTRDEAIAAADARFAALDTDHDGQVSADEMAAAMPPRRAARMGGGDMPPRPAMTRDQFRQRAVRQFDRLDANGDGRIDQTEIAQYRQAMQQRRDERRQDGAPAPAPAPAAPPPQR